jgi:hypothetical protein
VSATPVRRYDIIVDRSYAPHIAYANPDVITVAYEFGKGMGDEERLYFMGLQVHPTTPEQWQRALGLVVCGLAERYQK